MERREQILQTAAELFARNGYHGVSIKDLGAACGITGPALYKHFRGKQAILSEMLVDISDELLAEARRLVRSNDGDRAALEALVAWHVDFALSHPQLIVVQERDWSALPLESRQRVRDTQRKYVEVWVKVLRGLHDGLAPGPARAMVQATFGLINSTPRSARVELETMRQLLEQMATAALTAPYPS